MFGMPRRAVWPRNALVIAVGCSGLNAEKMFVFREKSFFFVILVTSLRYSCMLCTNLTFFREREREK